MIDKPLYKPVPKDLDWAKQMLDALRDGGVLTFPASQLTYHVDHEHKALTLQNLDQTVLSFDSFVVQCTSSSNYCLSLPQMSNCFQINHNPEQFDDTTIL